MCKRSISLTLALRFLCALVCTAAFGGESKDASATTRAKETEARFNELKTLALHGSYDEKQRAVKKLAELESHHSDVEPFLYSLLKKEDDGVHTPVIIALASFKDKPRIAYLLLAILKQHRELELPIAGSLIEMNDAALPAVIKALAQGDEHQAGICMIYFGSVPAQSLNGIPLSADEKKNIVRAVSRYLNPALKFATNQATASKQEDLTYKTTAINLLALLGPDAREAIPALEKMKDYEDGSLKEPAQKALDKIQK